MKNQLTILLVLIVSSLFGQYEDKDGYFITNDGEKIECLIFDKQWRNNPTEIQYRIKSGDDLKKKLVTDIKEFAINGGVKYIRYNVDYDISGTSYSNASKHKSPIFKKRLLFLKLLISGNVDLL